MCQFKFCNSQNKIEERQIEPHIETDTGMKDLKQYKTVKTRATFILASALC